jgi:hypothetical protein
MIVCSGSASFRTMPYIGRLDDRGLAKEVRASQMKRARSLALFFPSCLLLACAGVRPGATTSGSGGSGTGGTGNLPGTGGSTGAGGAVTPPPSGPCGGGSCNDFDGGPFGPDGTASSVPAGAAQAFGGTAAASGGPCLLEPQDGTLFPNNWLRPRFSWTAAGTGALYELHVSASNQSPDLVVYTTQTSWTMPKAMWGALAQHTQDKAISVTVLSATKNGSASTGTSANFTVAPVGASGSLVYWSPQGQTNGGNNAASLTTLNGFQVGDETVGQVLTCGKNGTTTVCDIKPTYWQTDDSGYNGRAVTCIGCHTSTPDGSYISFNDFYPWGGVLASGEKATLGMAPTFLGAGGYKAFVQPWVGITTYSPNHWKTGDHVAVAPLGSNNDDTDQQPGLAWFDLENASPLTAGQNPFTMLMGSAWNWIYAPKKGAYAAAPSWSHMSKDFIVFTMTSKVKSGRIGTGTAHLYQVNYNKAAAQTPTAIPGLDDKNQYAQYYGTLSFDDAYIVYDQIPAATANATHTDMNTSDASGSTWDGMYMQPATELFVTPTAGGPGTRLLANDPPACPGQPKSPGINNTWAKWSPEVSTANGSTYYWLIFSSWRQGDKDSTGDPIAQLFMTAIVKPEVGPIQTYPAVYLWNQPAKVSNFTPAWDVFKIGSVS